MNPGALGDAVLLAGGVGFTISSAFFTSIFAESILSSKCVRLNSCHIGARFPRILRALSVYFSACTTSVPFFFAQKISSRRIFDIEF